jgi:hypothetical protein
MEKIGLRDQLLSLELEAYPIQNANPRTENVQIHSKDF